MAKTLLLALLMMVPMLFGQTDTGALSGTISDPSGGAVANATVALENRATGLVRTTSTDSTGTYRFNLLAPGMYSISAQSQGFKRVAGNGVQIQVAREAELNLQLELGATAESVQVEAAASVLATESSAQGTVIGQEKIAALPLNGRQFIQLALLVPGANSGGRQVQQNTVRLNQTGGISSSGGRTNNNAFLLDGAVNTDPDYNAISYVPILDTIAEFQVQTAQFSAQYGRASGSQINVVTKQGSNELHGGAWEFLRNQELDARPFNSVTSSLARNQRNQYGAVAGGKILPNRLFFFGGYEGLRLRNAGTSPTTVAVPTALERTGDFSATGVNIYDPNSGNGTGAGRTQFPGNRVPATRVNALTLAAMGAMPLPNSGRANFVNTSEVLQQNLDNYSARIDYVVAPKVTLFGRYSIANENDRIPDVVTDRNQVSSVRPQNLALGSTQVLSPHAVNEIRVGFNRLRFLNGLPEPSFSIGGAQQLLPRFLPSGFAAMGGAGAYTGTQGGGTVLTRNNSYQLFDNFAWQRGRHDFKFGFEALKIEYNRLQSPSPLGSYTFTNGYTTRTAANDGTGNALASMLLGLTTQATRTVGPSQFYGRQWATSYYAQDDIRVRRNLTVNLGIRYELAPPMSDARQQLASIDFSKVPTPQAIFATGPLGTFKPTLFVCGKNGYPDGCAYTDYNNFSPRIGIAWTPIKKWVVRAGGGIYYATTDNNGLYNLASALPYNISQSLTASNFVPTLAVGTSFTGLVVGPTAIAQPSIDLHQRTSYAPQWSLTIQRELTRNSVIELGYLATLGIKLQQNVQPNNSQPGSAAVDPRRPFAGLVFDSGVSFPSYITVQGSSVPVQQVNVYQMSAQSNYHALFVRFEKRLSRGSSVLSSYTFGKAITNAPQYRNAGGANGSENSPPQDSYNLRAERSLASFDVRHRWVTSYVYELPFGKGHKWASTGVGAAILQGWQLSGILTLQAGFPFTINLQGDTAGIGGGTGGILVRANPVPGVSYALADSQKSTAQWFNPKAFAQPAAFTFGTLGRNTVIGPGLVTLDTTVSRNFRITERVSFQLRGEFFNLANHPNFNLVGRIINQPNFGAVLNQLDPRQIQIGGKFSF